MSDDLSLNELTRAIAKMAEASDATNKTLNNLVGKQVKADRNNSNNSNNKNKTSRDKALDAARSVLTRNLARDAQDLSGHLHSLSEGADGVSNIFKGFIGGFVGGSVVKDLIDASEGQAKQYRRLTDIGQTFGGSMLEMSAQAAKIDLPMENFTELLKRNSTLSAVMGQNQFSTSLSLGEMAKQVRASTKEFGFYGMSIDDISNLTSDYGETMRLQGRSSQIGTTATVKGMASFAQEITALSSATGKSREEIASITKEALRDVAVTSRQMVGQTSDVQNMALQRSVAFLAAMPGKTGNMMATMLSQTFGYGSAVFSDEGHKFIEAGAGQILGSFNKLSAKIASGETGDDLDNSLGDTLTEMQQSYAQLAPTLQAQARAGNSAARDVISYMDEMKGLNGQQLAMKMKEIQDSKGFTNFFLTISDTLNKIMGSFKVGFIEAIKPLEESFKVMTEGPGFANFLENMNKFGHGLGDVVNNIFTAKNLEAMSWGIEEFADMLVVGITAMSEGIGVLTHEDVRDSVHSFTDGLLSVFRTTKWIVDGLTTLIVPFFTMLKFGSDIVGNFFNGFENVLKFFHVSSETASGIRGITEFIAVFAGYKMIKNMFKAFGVVTMRAAVVNVHGSGIGGVSPNRSRPMPGGKGGFLGKGRGLVGAAIGIGLDLFGDSLVEGVVSKFFGGEKVAQEAASVAGITADVAVASKGLSRFIPFIGTAVGLSAAAVKAASGDYTGATLDSVAAGLLSTPLAPVGMGLGGISMMRDFIGPNAFDSAIMPGAALGDQSLLDRNTAAIAAPNFSNMSRDAIQKELDDVIKENSDNMGLQAMGVAPDEAGSKRIMDLLKLQTEILAALHKDTRSYQTRDLRASDNIQTQLQGD